MGETNYAGVPKDMRVIYPKTMQQGPYTVDAAGCKPIAGETIPRRHPVAIEKLLEKPSEEVGTTYDILRRSAQKYGNAKALGSRKLVRTHVESKKVKKIVDGKPDEVDKKWTYFELSDYNYISFEEYMQQCLQLASGLRKMGLQKGDRLHLFAATSAHWLAMSHAAASQSIPVATAYDTLGAEGLKYSLKQTEAVAVYCDPHLLKTLVEPLKSDSTIRLVVYDTTQDVATDHIDELKRIKPDVTILSFEELRLIGEKSPVEPVPPSPEDLCCIMYTSGSTGVPKGVPLRHKALVAAVAGATTIYGRYIGPGDRLLTYLPLAHILEFVFENACLFWGGTMGYGNPKTLSDASVRNCQGDIRAFGPTIIVGVPAVWESVKKGILGKLNAGSVIARNAFWAAFTLKGFLMSTGLPGTAVLDALIFQKIKQATGGQLRVCLSGGGPIAKETQRFISIALTPMLMGYGLTETTAMGVLMDPLHWTDHTLGDLPSSIEVKLVDFAEAGYFASNDPPQGEVLIRGTPVMEGYFKNEEETAKAFSKDGWFMTGDIGQFDKNGHLVLIDRKKNLVKTLNGEYIALEKLESIYRSASVVANICVYAASDQNKPVAIIVPAEPALKKLAKENGIAGDSAEELVHDKRLNKLVLSALQDTGRSGGLVGIEIIEGVVLAEDEWTPSNGLTTAAQKVNRKAILAKFQQDVDQAYGK